MSDRFDASWLGATRVGAGVDRERDYASTIRVTMRESERVGVGAIAVGVEVEGANFGRDARAGVSGFAEAGGIEFWVSPKRMADEDPEDEPDEPDDDDEDDDDDFDDDDLEDDDDLDDEDEDDLDDDLDDLDDEFDEDLDEDLGDLEDEDEGEEP
jgi:hypothetical protein